ncbi:MAG: U32 family peptidase C-terminal domain-containing protein [Patescibacteria group bacterium]|nr:U32 family peptidase C-terminal domain-containing protein [Patescibacteria group bacterium]
MKKAIKKIELLCPAGDLERLKTAVVFGADAVYCGLPSWSLRNPREITFTLKTLKEGIKFAHERGVKVYLTFNVFPHENQLKEIERALKEIKIKLQASPDGVIVSDLGMFSLVKKYLPKVEIHISTQANTLNSEGVMMWGKLGAQRVVLARETTLEEIKEIKKRMAKSPMFNLGDSPKLNIGTIPELEVFGHGAMCMAYSGRCLLSKYFTGREANLGDCAQSCRWKYKVKMVPKSDIKINLDVGLQECFLEEETRPRDLVEVQEDENGTYFMNSKEICSLDILDKFIESGIDSLKIEGRAKSIYYLAVVTRIYRKAINAYYVYCHPRASVVPNRKSRIFDKNREKYQKLIKDLYKELNMIQHRGYSHGFLLGRHDYEQEYNVAAFRPPVIPIGQIISVVSSHQGSELNSEPTYLYLVEVKNKFKVGDKVEIITPDEIIKTKIKEIRKNIGAQNFSPGPELEEILKPQEKVWVTFDAPSGIPGTRKKEIPERSILRKKIHPVK